MCMNADDQELPVLFTFCLPVAFTQSDRSYSAAVPTKQAPTCSESPTCSRN